MPDLFQSQTLNMLHTHRIIAVIRVDDLTPAVEFCRALVAGGIRALEFTLTMPDALPTMQRVMGTLPEWAAGQITIGVGSVTTHQQVGDAAAAGAQFAVSPHLEPDLVAASLDAGLVSVPGTMTPTEMVQATAAGAHMAKVFPAPFFGPDYLKTVLAPLPHLQLMPSGGITRANIGDYLQAGAVCCGVGSDLLDEALIAARDWDGLTARARQLVDKANAV